MGGTGDFRRCEVYGANLAEQVLKAVAAEQPVSGSNIQIRATRYDVPLENLYYHVGFFAGHFHRDSIILHTCNSLRLDTNSTHKLIYQCNFVILPFDVL